jgi:uncharacterized protein (DUF1684 family)
MSFAHRFSIVVTALTLVAACTSGPGAPDPGVQLKELQEHRTGVERFMREADNSPIPRDKMDTLLPLRYFEPDVSYSTAAQLDLSEPGKRPVAEMPTSTGSVTRYERVGFLRFTLKGEQYSLGAFVPEGTQRISELFVPFADGTNGKDTYAAGRYLNLVPTSTGLYRIDFNYAYNPYCAYNKEYECPYPPPGNRLKIPIAAGEKVPVS